MGGILLALIGLSVLYYFQNPSNSRVFLQCPFHWATGYHCAGCGSQRAIHLLLHGDLYSAFRMNPFMVLSLPLVFAGVWTQAKNYLFQTKDRIKLFYNKWFIYGYFGLAVLYWIVRNFSFPPFNWLAPTTTG